MQVCKHNIVTEKNRDTETFFRYLEKKKTLPITKMFLAPKIHASKRIVQMFNISKPLIILQRVALHHR